jgi:IS1 family transposase
MANVLSRARQLQVIHLLAEGNSIRSIERLTGVQKKTVCRLLVSFGTGCRELLDREMRGLALDHLEVDEIWTFVCKKQSRLTTTERAERHDIGDIYLWTILDQQTKLIPTFAIGKRSADNARRLMLDLSKRLVRPLPHASDAHGFQAGQYEPICQLSTDGFAGYPEAVDLAFGPYVKYGQIIKQFRNANLPYTPSEIVGTERRGIRDIDDDEISTICTSHVERHNWTIRIFMKRFTRLSAGFSKKLDNLAAAVSLFMAYYNFCWRPRHPDHSGRRGRLRPTPAMAAGVTDTLWSLETLYDRVHAQ